MEFKFDKKQTIEFKTDIMGLAKFAPVVPAQEAVPNWFKEMKHYIEEKPQGWNPQAMPGRAKNLFGKMGKTAQNMFYSFTVKRCPAIVDIMTEGFVVPMWSDFLIQRGFPPNMGGEEILEWDNRDFPYGASFHQNNQIYNWDLPSKSTYKHPLKFHSPWKFFTPKGYSTLFIPYNYDFQTDYSVLPGIVETDTWHEVNFPTLIHKKKDFMIKRGTPFVQAIPFKRSKWNFKMDMVTEKEVAAENARKNFTSGNFNQGYRKATKLDFDNA